jgi:hypothetical protein
VRRTAEDVMIRLLPIRVGLALAAAGAVTVAPAALQQQGQNLDPNLFH